MLTIDANMQQQQNDCIAAMQRQKNSGGQFQSFREVKYQERGNKLPCIHATKSNKFDNSNTGQRETQGLWWRFKDGIMDLEIKKKIRIEPHTQVSHTSCYYIKRSIKDLRVASYSLKLYFSKVIHSSFLKHEYKAIYKKLTCTTCKKNQIR